MEGVHIAGSEEFEKVETSNGYTCNMPITCDEASFENYETCNGESGLRASVVLPHLPNWTVKETQRSQESFSEGVVSELDIDGAADRRIDKLELTAEISAEDPQSVTLRLTKADSDKEVIVFDGPSVSDSFDAELRFEEKEIYDFDGMEVAGTWRLEVVHHGDDASGVTVDRFRLAIRTR
jgi:hypothetical protein